jgi:hypothetical protein
MSAATRLKLLFATAVIVAAVVGPSGAASWPGGGGWKAALIVFGLYNAVVAVPGTFAVRAGTVVLTVVALAFWPASAGVSLLLSWFLWPPAYMAGWALAKESRLQGESGDAAAESSGRSARMAVAAIIGTVAVGSFAYRLIVAHDLQQTAALFIGIPALMAILVVVAVSPRSATGVACKAVTVGLLVSMLFLHEGVLCVLMSAPLFFLVAIAIASIMQGLRERGGHTTMYSCAVAVLMVPLSLEGITSYTSFNREELVSETRVIAAPAVDVAHALFAPPRFDRRLPPYLRAGFPMAVTTRIERLAGATRWIIRVRGGEMRINGMEPREGNLVLELEESRPGLVRWRVVSDDSHMTHFLFWREIIVRWHEVMPGRTEITWTLRYERGLDPAWYFGPWERYAVHLAAGYLIDAVATP